jgi:hypothetical protein
MAVRTGDGRVEGQPKERTMSGQDVRREQAEQMTTEDLRRAVKRLGVRPQGGLSRASRRNLIDWYVMNTPRQSS